MYGRDMHRKGQHEELVKMHELAHTLTKGKDMGRVFLTEGYEDDFDMIQLVPNKQAFTKYEGYVLYSETLNKPVFIKKEEN